jgi:hypothetical protein
MEGYAIFFPTSTSSEWTPLSRGSDGRFGLRRFRAKLTPTPFGTHRAFTHALPPSSGLRSVGDVKWPHIRRLRDDGGTCRANDALRPPLVSIEVLS